MTFLFCSLKCAFKWVNLYRLHLESGGLAEVTAPPPDTAPIIELRVPSIGEGSPDLGTVLNRTAGLHRLLHPVDTQHGFMTHSKAPGFNP